MVQAPSPLYRPIRPRSAAPAPRPLRAPAGRHRFEGGLDELRDRQITFQLARQLARAQFVEADPQHSDRLWQEVAALRIDPERIIALLYGGVDLDDSEAMEAIDAPRRRPAPRRWWSWLGRGADRCADAGGCRR